MRRNVQQSIRSLRIKLQSWIGASVATIRQTGHSVADSVAHPPHAMVKWAPDILPPVGIIVGAVAFGLWWNSIGAGLFACFLLFFLVGICKTLERIVVALQWDADRVGVAKPNSTPSSAAERNDRDVYVSTKAIECLRPWVEDERSLTEETAKAYCSVLLDTLAILHPKLAGRPSAGGRWS